jgi:formiminotetrahydrofolate cyclodeaminase
MGNSAAAPGASPPLSEMSVAELLEAVAARTPSPGGGAVAGVACALAAALVQMTASFGSGSEARAAGARAAQLRAAALRLADEDRDAYGPVLEALALPAGSAERRQRLVDAQSAASEPPLGIAATAGEVAQLGVTAIGAVGPHLYGDAVAGVLLAEAAGAAAAQLVAINLHQQADDPRHREAGQAAERALQARREISANRND